MEHDKTIEISMLEYERLLTSKLITEQNILMNELTKWFLNKEEYNPEFKEKLEDEINKTKEKLHLIKQDNDSYFKEMKTSMVDELNNIKETLKEMNNIMVSLDVNKLKESIDMKLEAEAYMECGLRKIKGERLDYETLAKAHKFIQRSIEDPVKVTR